jgi:pyruvate kinase
MASQTIDPQIILSAIPLGKPQLKPPKTRIICTVAPLNVSGNPTDEKEEVDCEHTKKRVQLLVEAGMSIVRINFSHVTSNQQRENVWKLIKITREVSDEMMRPIGILMDLRGPRPRIGKVKEGLSLEKGEEYILTTKFEKGEVGNEKRCFIDYENFAKDIMIHRTTNPKTCVYIDDGKLKLEVLEATETDVRCRVNIGGPLGSNKGINVPRVKLSTGALTRKDIQDLEWIFDKENEEQKSNEQFKAVDFIALSFVKKPDEIDYFNALLGAYMRKLPIVAKIETAEAVEEENRKGILEELRGRDTKETGAVMIARGDLAIETSHEKVPELQTTLIDECNKMEIPVIVATQLLESMCENQWPFRSEVVDIVNAVREGADMVMLSRETASGKYPLQATKTMASVLKMAEEERRKFTRESMNEKKITKWDIIEFFTKDSSQSIPKTTTEAIANPACRMAESIQSPAIVVCAATGTTAKKCASFRPRPPIIAITLYRETAVNLLLYRGVYPVLIGYEPENIEQLLKVIEGVLEKLHIGQKGDLVVSTFGAQAGMRPLSTHGELGTNTMRIIEIKETITVGQPK